MRNKVCLFQLQIKKRCYPKYYSSLVNTSLHGFGSMGIMHTQTLGYFFNTGYINKSKPINFGHSSIQLMSVTFPGHNFYSDQELLMHVGVGRWRTRIKILFHFFDWWNCPDFLRMIDWMNLRCWFKCSDKIFPYF